MIVIYLTIKKEIEITTFLQLFRLYVFLFIIIYIKYDIRNNIGSLSLLSS